MKKKIDQFNFQSILIYQTNFLFEINHKFSRKAAASSTDFEVWGDGLQTRSFCYVDDCVDGVLKLMRSDCKEPLNIGSEEMVLSKKKTRFLNFFKFYLYQNLYLNLNVLFFKIN